MKQALFLSVLAILAAALLIPGASFVYESGGPQACGRCHEMGTQVALWQNSAHRDVPCTKCHGDALSADMRYHVTNARRVYDHLRDDVPEQSRLAPAAVFQIVERCRGCHLQEFAAWSSGPHAVPYKRLFTDEKHNSTRRLMDDCLRCHGAHFDGAIRDLVSPVATKGPWKLLRPELADRPAVPCLQCHAMHRSGATLKQRLLESKTPGDRQEVHRPGLAFYDRRSGESISASLLPVPVMLDGDRPVRMSPDPRQTLCFQCHAALATRQVGSGDDRTPKGVHEGISCLACHDRHRQTTRASCATCHPKMSNCGLDVEKMDTTFTRESSKHNIHFVACRDCHEKGVPRSKRRELAE